MRPQAGPQDVVSIFVVSSRLTRPTISRKLIHSFLPPTSFKGENQVAETDSYTQDAVRRAMAEDVEKKVYDRIKGDFLKLKFLGAGGVILLVVLGLFHQQIFSLIVSYGNETYKRLMDDHYKRGLELQSKLENTRTLIESDVASHFADFSKQRRAIMALEAEVNASLHEASDLVHTLTDLRQTITQRTAASQSTATDAQAQLKELQARVDQSLARIDSLVSNQNTIVSQLKIIKADVPDNRVTAQATPLEVKRKIIIYFQFAGFVRSEATGISDKLRVAGWEIPGEERTPIAANKADTNQIRYNPSDAADAQRLKQDADSALRALGIPVDLKLQPYPKGPPGIIEIWILKP